MQSIEINHKQQLLDAKKQANEAFDDLCFKIKGSNGQLHAALILPAYFKKNNKGKKANH